MKNLKEKKGITLVALIITIIVLLILAVVTISAVNEGSLFAHANNAATSYSKAQEEENTMISNWLTELGKHDREKNTKSEQLETSDVAGTYYVYISNAKQLESIVLNDDAEKTGKINNDSITYTYDEEQKKITLSVGGEMNFRTIGNNKLLFVWEKGMFLIFTTNGNDSITALSETYELDESIVFHPNGTVTMESEEGKYCVIDNCIYYNLGGNYFMVEK